MLGAMGRPRWSKADLEGASPEVVEAARWELYASRIWPAELEEALAAPEDPTESDRKRARYKAEQLIAELRKVLLPADEVPVS